ncbi:hypothetical protein [Planomonospora sp. ID82291]|uniref:hypothetical protein n=1 Tax=Planomonospora sp. ID82291 TaxID=2738136 RepID=UPI0018C37BC4|nr:hypothetical protein [Planomonospora sp. ID82291]MBG0818351.1 hypothetical protein [Planomonospora sp. ID82291]
MAYSLSNTRAAYRRAKVFGEELLAAGDAIVASGGVTVLEPYQVIFPTMYGWWRFINHSARLLWQATESGFSAEVSALMRNIVDHTYSMVWLADVGEEGLVALEDARAEGIWHIYEEAKKAGWTTPPETDLPPVPVEPSDPAERKRYRKLKGEITTFVNLTTAFKAEDMYVVYRHLSDYTHAGAVTAGRYAKPTGDGKFVLTDMARSLGAVDAIWTTASLIQAGHALSRMVEGDPMRSLLEKAAKDMGLPSPEHLVPVRRQKEKKQGKKAKGATAKS